jgi:hypothetical protein
VHLGAEVLYHSAMGDGDPGATQPGPPIGSYATVDGPRIRGTVEGERVSPTGTSGRVDKCLVHLSRRSSKNPRPKPEDFAGLQVRQS